jgi:hypothetical protein
MTYFAFSNLDSKFRSYGFSEDDKQLIDIMLIIMFGMVHIVFWFAKEYIGLACQLGIIEAYK